MPEVVVMTPWVMHNIGQLTDDQLAAALRCVGMYRDAILAEELRRRQKREVGVECVRQGTDER